ncbi:MAG: ATP-binding protein [Phycisphaeraceae bacterium]
MAVLSFDDVKGQSRAISTLETQLASSRLHHGLIFHGPMGVGKARAARALAGVLLCHQPEHDLTGRPRPCGSCASCRLLASDEQELGEDEADEEQGPAASSNHPDFHVVTKELALFSSDASTRRRVLTQFPVDVVREHLVEPVYRRPQVGRGKVFVVEEAELLNPASQNALLKTLEEPPPETTLILITTREERLLPTIRSRCQRQAFVPLPDDAVADYLDQHGELEGRLRDWAIAFSAGSLGRAKLVLDYGLTTWAKEVLPAAQKLCRGQPQPELGKTMADLIDGFGEAWVKSHANASKEAAKRRGAELMWALLSHYARRGLNEAALQHGGAADDRDVVEAALEPWLETISSVSEAQSMVDANVHLALVCDHLSMSMDASLSKVRLV